MIQAVGALNVQNNVTNAANDIELCSGAGDLSLFAALTATNRTVRFHSEEGRVTQSVAGTITAANLGVRAQNDIDLDSANNNIIGVFAARSSTAGHIEFRDLGGFTVGSVTAGACLPLVTGVTTTNGDVTLTTTGAITLASITTAGGTHTVSMNAGASINGSALVTANTIDLNAITGIGNSAAVNAVASNITADTTHGNIDLNNALATATLVSSLTTGVGNITFDQSGGGAVTFTTATTGTGNIGLTSASAQLTLGTISAGGTTHDVTVTTTASGNIFVGSVTAADDVTMNAAGSILDNSNDTLVDVRGQLVTLTATSGVGATAGNGSLDTAADQLDVSVTGAGIIHVNEANAVELLAFDTANGSITVTAGGAITATYVNSSATDNNTNDIRLTTTSGRLLVGAIDAGSVNDVELISAAAIEESGTDSTADVSGGDLRLVAATGIGSLDKIEIDATHLAVTTGSGDITLTDTAGGLTITTIGPTVGVSITTGAVGDDIVVTTLGGSSFSVNSGVTNAGGGTLTLAAEGSVAAADLTVSANITATGGSGSVWLLAGDDLSVSLGSVSAIGSGTVSLRAGRDFNGGTPQAGHTAGDLSLESGTTVQSQVGTLSLDATQHVTVAGTVQSTSGAIVIGADDAMQLNTGGQSSPHRERSTSTSTGTPRDQRASHRPAALSSKPDMTRAARFGCRC